MKIDYHNRKSFFAICYRASIHFKEVIKTTDIQAEFIKNKKNPLILGRYGVIEFKDEGNKNLFLLLSNYSQYSKNTKNAIPLIIKE